LLRLPLMVLSVASMALHEHESVKEMTIAFARA